MAASVTSPARWCLLVACVLIPVVAAYTRPYQARCPSGCRCVEPDAGYGRHRYHRILAAYRMRMLVYGHQKSRGPLRYQHGNTDKQSGREIVCLGLSAIPAQIPADTTKVTLYGNTRGSTLQQDSPRSAGFSGIQSTTYQQITNMQKAKLGPSVTELTIEGNRIKVLHPNDFDTLHKLKSLHMRNNRLKEINVKSFSGLKELEELDLSKNHVKRLSKTLFYDTPKLKKLFLQNNRIRGMHRKILKSLKYLEVLNVADNYLRNLHPDLFIRSENLRELILDDNHIKEIRTEWFRHTASLTKLSLKGNRLLRLQHGCFRYLPSLKQLYLDKNELKMITEGSFEGLDSLQTLSLQTNNISQIAPGSFMGMPHLRQLVLGSNGITTLTNGTFAGLEKLETLVLSKNALLEINKEMFIAIPHLVRLDFSNNHIKTIRERNFFGLLELRELRLDHNDIKVIETEAFAVSVVNNFSKLTWLYLQYNKIGTVSERMLYGLPYCKFLNLGHNRIDSIAEGGFSMLGRLHTLVLSQNQLDHLEVGVFKHMKYVNHLNLADNSIRDLSFNVFLGLERAEDINLMGNKLEVVSEDAFLDTPKLVALNLKKNALRKFDLSILETAVRMRYLDLAHNALATLTLPSTPQNHLFYLNVADNNLRELQKEIIWTMTHGGSMHLYGNPWSCDCQLAWIHEVKNGGTVKLPESEDIVCKSPREVSGEQVLSLRQEDMNCAAADTGNEAKLSCNFLDHATDENTREHVKARKNDLEDWYVTFLDVKANVLCSGVIVARDWVLTPSRCWKHVMRQHVNVTFGQNHRSSSFKEVEVLHVEHFEGKLDIALVKVSMLRDDYSMHRVFPCVLSEDGIQYANRHRVNGILQARGSTSRNNFNVKLRGVVLKVTGCSGSSVCVMDRSGILTQDEYDTIEEPFYAKVGRTRWALVGFTSGRISQNIAKVDPLFPAIRWLEKNTL